MYTLGTHVRYIATSDYGVLLDTRTGKLRSLNRCGGDLLRALIDGHSIGEWVVRTADRYHLPSARVQSDAEVFIDGLVSLGLVHQTTSNGAPER